MRIRLNLACLAAGSTLVVAAEPAGAAGPPQSSLFGSRFDAVENRLSRNRPVPPQSSLFGSRFDFRRAAFELRVALRLNLACLAAGSTFDRACRKLLESAASI